jgi:hypothetical protein
LPRADLVAADGYAENVHHTHLRAVPRRLLDGLIYRLLPPWRQRRWRILAAQEVRGFSRLSAGIHSLEFSMPHVVVRVYDNAPGLIEFAVSHKEEIRELLNGVPGFIAWGGAKTSDTGGLSITHCETAEGCAESTRRFAEWLPQQLPNIPAPTVFSGERIYHFTANKPEAQPHVVVRIMHAPPPAGLKQAVTGERMLAMPGFRSNTAVDLGDRGMTILVADDKAAADEIRTMQADWVRTNHPDWIPSTPADVIEGTAIVRIVAAGVLA